MPRPKLTSAIINNRLAGRHLRLLGEWVDATTPHTYHCDVCGHEWLTVGVDLPNNPKRGCPRCFLLRRAPGRFLPHREVKARLDEVHLDLVGGIWKGHHDTHTFHCRVCGFQWDITGEGPLGKKRGCPECAKLKRRG